ncbi:MAG: 8-amino-7-oxononanoate synthase [Nitrospirae bacterium]|nr:8-amino-7-oxononanoate synthase [Nitrospirota bacterium]
MYNELLNSIKSKNLYRKILDRESAQGRIITINSNRLLNFSSNDYLGLASNPEIFDSAASLAREYGSAGASRLLSGGCSLHQRLESQAARFKGADRALIFNSGYAANVGVIPTLVSKVDAIFSDKLNHASIIDGCRLSKADIYIYNHNDPAHLETLLKQTNAKIKLVITESVFSMDGDIAPIPEISDLCRSYNAILYIDEAHATGVLSKYNINYDYIIYMGTFSKALGSYGGYIASSNTIIDYLINTCRSLIYSTALPAFNIAASICALDYMIKHPELNNRLIENVKTLRTGLIEAGFNVSLTPTPIIPILLDSSADALELSKYLFEHGIYVPAIRPPTVTEPRLRISLSAFHTTDDLNLLIDNLQRGLKCILH